MNCDLVFDILTRGPFPAGDPSDDAVERHLAACHECRQLAEALRPAVDLFHESFDDCENLPGYRGTLDANERTTGSVMIKIKNAKATPVASTRARTNPVTATNAIQLAGAALVIAVLSLVAWTSNGMNSSGTDSQDSIATSPESAANYVPNLKGREMLLALGLSGECLTVKNVSTNVAATDARTRTNFLCCTQCHAAANPNRPALNSIAKLKQSCEACHDIGL